MIRQRLVRMDFDAPQRQIRNTGSIATFVALAAQEARPVYGAIAFVWLSTIAVSI